MVRYLRQDRSRPVLQKKFLFWGFYTVESIQRALRILLFINSLSKRDLVKYRRQDRSRLVPTTNLPFLGILHIRRHSSQSIQRFSPCHYNKKLPRIPRKFLKNLTCVGRQSVPLGLEMSLMRTVVFM